MRFLLDEMYPSVAAEQLRQRGVDALAVKESEALTGLTDADLLTLAGFDQRVLVTENISDFAVLARTIDHCGVVFCHPRRFPRRPSHIQRLVAALAALDDSSPEGLGDRPTQWWLGPPTS